MSEPLFTVEQPAAPEVVVPKMTERFVLDALARYYSPTNPGNGPRYAIAEHVRSHAGFDARRTADLIVMDLWPSKGLHLIGHEVKVSRSDWLTELRDPSKADEFRRYMDQWYLVCPPGVTKGDVPFWWGIIEVTPDGKARVRRPAPVRHDAEPLPKTMLAALLRSTAKTARRDVS